jgi:hypothetical protein
MSAPNSLHICERGHVFHDEEPFAVVQSPTVCPCGAKLLAKLYHYGTEDPNECRFGDRKPISYQGVETVTMQVSTGFHYTPNGIELEYFRFDTYRLRTYDTSPLWKEKRHRKKTGK